MAYISFVTYRIDFNIHLALRAFEIIEIKYASTPIFSLELLCLYRLCDASADN